MKLTNFLLGGALAAMLSATATAMTIELPVTADYVREHPKEWSVKVSKNKNGLIQFQIIRVLAELQYLVAHLAVRHTGKAVAESDTPMVGRKQNNTFYFALAAEDLAEATFDLSESGFGMVGDQVVPYVGSQIHQFKLREFVPENLRTAAPEK